MKIRAIENKDIKSCLDIYNYYIENTTITFEEEKLNLFEFSKRCEKIKEKYPYIVCENDNGEVLGYAYLSAYSDRSAFRITADLSIYLSKDHMHKHIGSLLLKKIEKLGKKQNILNIISIVTEENINSNKFHESHGFVLEGTMHDVGFKFGRILGVNIFRKALK